MFSITLYNILRNNMIKYYKFPYNYQNLQGKGIVVFRKDYNKYINKSCLKKYIIR